MSDSGVGVGRAISRWRPVERLGARLADSPHRRSIVLGLAFAALILLVILGSIEQVLRALHEPGGERAGIASLANNLFAGPDVRQYGAVLREWRDTAELQSADAGAILATYAIVDGVFAFVYVALGGLLLVLLRRELGPPRKRDPLEGLAAARTVGHEDLTPYQTPVKIALLSLGFLFVVDLVESFLLLLSTGVRVPTDKPVGDGATLVASALWATYRLKLGIAFFFVLVPGVVAALTFLAQRPERRAGVWPAFSVARGQLLVVVILFAGLFVSDQAVDALRRWYEDAWDATFAIGMLAWLALFLIVSTSGLLHSAARRRSGSDAEGTFLALGLVVGLVALLSFARFGVWIGLATLAGLFLAIGLLSLLVVRVPSAAEGRVLGGARNWLPGSLGLLVLLAPVLALIGAATGPVVLSQFQFLWLGVPVGVLLVIGFLFYWLRDRLVEAWDSRLFRRAFLVVTALVVALVWYRVVEDPWGTSDAFGAVAFLVTFLLALSLILFLLIRRAEEVRPPDIVALVRLRCTPVILLAVAWIAVTSALDRETTYHDVRVLGQPSSPAPRVGLTPKQAFARWLEMEPRPAKVRPMLFVAAAGGGIRAAYWTATVLTCVLEADEPKHVPPTCSRPGANAAGRGPATLFVGSGASGGSVGLASYATHAAVSPDDPEWPSGRLDEDFAAALVGWGLFVDVPSALVRRRGGSDRAEILERAFERSWLRRPNQGATRAPLRGDSATSETSPLARGLLQPWEAETSAVPRPLLMLNGTKVQQGCRINVSVLDAAVEPASRSEQFVEDCVSLRLFELADQERRATWSLASSDDLLTYLCTGEDLRLSTAALLSARFPWVLPSGRLRRASETSAGCGHTDVSPANVVDGGYFDTSGASPAVELWGVLAREVVVANRNGACIVPYFLQIDTGYADPVRRGDLSPSEVLVPAVTALRARDAREHNARQAAALLFTGRQEAGPANPDRYAHIYPRAHAGVRAPLGWTLSEAARKELDGQLEQNESEIAKVRGWLTDLTSCR